MTVNKERVQLLVDALRSGEFTQGKAALEYIDNSITKNCCLGVATRVAMRNGVTTVHDGRDSGIGAVRFVDNNGQYYRCYLPDSVQQWYGFSENNPLLSHSTSAIQANDNLKWNFEEIADAFERYYINNDNDSE